MDTLLVSHRPVTNGKHHTFSVPLAQCKTPLRASRTQLSMPTVIPTAIYLLSRLGTRNQHCQRNGAQITGTPFCPHKEHRPQCSHFQNPASAWHQPLHWHRTGLVILVPLPPVGPAGSAWVQQGVKQFFHVIPGFPYLGGPLASRFLFCCFRVTLFLSHTEQYTCLQSSWLNAH